MVTGDDKAETLRCPAEYAGEIGDTKVNPSPELILFRGTEGRLGG
jgi:hypothetical protein